jgi:hypothetical protein
VFSGPAAAQQTQKAHPTPAPWQIILPPKLIAGADATLAVIDLQGRLLPNVTVELSSAQKVTTDVTGRATFRAAEAPGKIHAQIPGQAVAASAEILGPEDPAIRVPPGGATGDTKLVTYPRVLAIQDRFILGGVGFAGVADLNHVDLNDDPCLVLASSPVSLVALPGPRAPVGDAALHFSGPGNDAGKFQVSVVQLEFSGPPEAPNAGSAGQLTVRAIGTTRPLLLEVHSVSPAVIQLAKGNVERVKTSGGDENVALVDVKFLTGGNYAVSARLISAEGNSPDLESARQRLAEARKIAPGDWPARIDQLLQNIDRAPEDLPRIRAELRAMLDDKPGGPLGSLLDSAWRELN